MVGMHASSARERLRSTYQPAWERLFLREGVHAGIARGTTRRHVDDGQAVARGGDGGEAVRAHRRAAEDVQSTELGHAASLSYGALEPDVKPRGAQEHGTDKPASETRDVISTGVDNAEDILVERKQPQHDRSQRAGGNHTNTLGCCTDSAFSGVLGFLGLKVLELPDDGHDKKRTQPDCKADSYGVLD